MRLKNSIPTCTSVCTPLCRYVFINLYVYLICTPEYVYTMPATLFILSTVIFFCSCTDEGRYNANSALAVWFSYITFVDFHPIAIRQFIVCHWIPIWRSSKNTMQVSKRNDTEKHWKDLNKYNETQKKQMYTYIYIGFCVCISIYMYKYMYMRDWKDATCTRTVLNRRRPKIPDYVSIRILPANGAFIIWSDIGNAMGWWPCASDISPVSQHM